MRSNYKFGRGDSLWAEQVEITVSDQPSRLPWNAVTGWWWPGFDPVLSQIFRRQIMKAILSMALVLGFCGLAVAADKVDAVGTWKCEYEIGGQMRMSTLTIKKEGDTLTATMSWPDQKETNLKDL